MENRRLALLLTILALGVISGKCPKNSINPNDSTKPTITIKVRDKDGQYKEMSNTTLKVNGSDTLTFMCIVDDPEGVRSVGYSYSGGINSCRVNGDTFIGASNVEPLPPPAEQVLSGDANSQVLLTLPLISNPDLKGPFTCKAPPAGLNGTGVPVNEKITVNCDGTNWSSDNQKRFAAKTLTVNLN